MKVIQFQIDKKLYADAIGSVYSLSHDEDAGFIKILHQDLANHDEFVETFHVCAEKSCSIKSEFYIKALSHGQENGSHFIVYEKSNLVPLNQLISKSEILSVSDAMTFVESLANILRNAHLDESVHAHISPQVIYSDLNYKQVRIADFAFHEFISFLISKEKYQSLLEVLPYYSPEFILGKKPVRRQADIYSLGVIFYRLLVGEVPWLDQGLDDFFHKPEQRSVVPPSLKRLEVPDYFDELILKSLEPAVENRCPSLSEFLKGMAEIKAELTTKPAPTSQILTSAIETNANEISEKEPETKEAQIEDEITTARREKQVEAEPETSTPKEEKSEVLIEQQNRPTAAKMPSTEDTSVAISESQENDFQPEADTNRRVTQENGSGDIDVGEEKIDSEKTLIRTEQLEEIDAVFRKNANLKTTPPLHESQASVQRSELSDEGVGSKDDVVSDLQHQEVVREDAPMDSSNSIDSEAKSGDPESDEEASSPIMQTLEYPEKQVRLNEKGPSTLEKNEGAENDLAANETDTVEVEMSKLWQQAQIGREELSPDEEKSEIKNASNEAPPPSQVSIKSSIKEPNSDAEQDTPNYDYPEIQDNDAPVLNEAALRESEESRDEVKNKVDFGFEAFAETETDSEDNEISSKPFFDTSDMFGSDESEDSGADPTSQTENSKTDSSANSELELNDQSADDSFIETLGLGAHENSLPVFFDNLNQEELLDKGAKHPQEKTKEEGGFDVRRTASMVPRSLPKSKSGVNPAASKPQFGPENAPQVKKDNSKVPFTSEDEPIAQFKFNNSKQAIRFYKKQVKGRSFLNALRTFLIVLVPILAIYLLIAITFDFKLIDRFKAAKQEFSGGNEKPGFRPSNTGKAAPSPQDSPTEPASSVNRMTPQTQANLASKNGQSTNPSVKGSEEANVSRSNMDAATALNLQLTVDDGQRLQVADVFINGNRYGTTNLRGRLTLANLLPNRSYLLKIQKPGFEMWAREVSFPAPGTRRLNVSLKSLPAPATASRSLAAGGQANVTVLLSNPQNVSYAFVYVNGQLWEGEDNIAPAKLQLPAGDYEVEVRRDGYRAHPPVNSLSLRNGDDKTIYFYLIPN